MNKQRLLLVAIAGLHMGYILAVNTNSAIAGYQTYYQNTTEGPHGLKILLGGRPQQWYGLLSGTGHGYGFFAPNVASQYVSRFRLYHADGRIISELNTPKMYSKDGLQRYSVWLEQFQRFLKEREQDEPAAILYRRYLKAGISSMCRRLLAENPAADRISCELYLHQPPLLKSGNKTSANFIQIYRYRTGR